MAREHYEGIVLMSDKKPWLDTAKLSNDELLKLYASIPHGPASGVHYNDVMYAGDVRTSPIALVVECAERFAKQSSEAQPDLAEVTKILELVYRHTTCPDPGEGGCIGGAISPYGCVHEAVRYVRRLLKKE